MNVDCAPFLTCLFFFLCACVVFYPANRAGCANLWWYLRVLGVLIGVAGAIDLAWNSTCCSAVFGTPRQTAAATQHPRGGPLLRRTSLQSGTPNLPPMLNAAGPVSRRRSQRLRGLWYVATGNARQMAAWDCIERFQVMAASYNCRSKGQASDDTNCHPRFSKSVTIKCVSFCEILVPAIRRRGLLNYFN